MNKKLDNFSNTLEDAINLVSEIQYELEDNREVLFEIREFIDGKLGEEIEDDGDGGVVYRNIKWNV